MKRRRRGEDANGANGGNNGINYNEDANDDDFDDFIVDDEKRRKRRTTGVVREKTAMALTMGRRKARSLARERHRRRRRMAEDSQVDGSMIPTILTRTVSTRCTRVPLLKEVLGIRITSTSLDSTLC